VTAVHPADHRARMLKPAKTAIPRYTWPSARIRRPA
jgi:hypothetical protein